MPLFEFECVECKESFEELVLSISAVPDVSCPHCSSSYVEKKISTFASKIAGGSSISVSSAPSSACNPGSV